MDNNRTEGEFRRGSINPLTVITQPLIHSLREISSIADKGAVSLIMGGGGLCLLIAIAMKLNYGNYHLALLQPAEFISLLSVGAFLLLSGAIVKIYHYNITLKNIVKQEDAARAELESVRNQLDKVRQEMREITKKDF